LQAYSNAPKEYAMKRHGRLMPVVLFCLLLSFSAAHATPAPAPSPVAKDKSPLCSGFNEFNGLFRDGRISKVAARTELSMRLVEIRNEYYQRDGRDYSSTDWAFPPTGYDARPIDKGRSHGFVPSGCDFFGGNHHGGHPAYDIFIRDRNQDSRDDRSVLDIHPKQKAIIVSGFSESDRVHAAQALGAGVYVRKPHVIKKLGLTVRKELDRK
jgi:hypothetical protein